MAGKWIELSAADGGKFRGYLTVPADQIKDITSVLTMVGGRVVYDAAKEQSTGTR